MGQEPTARVRFNLDDANGKVNSVTHPPRGTDEAHAAQSSNSDTTIIVEYLDY